MLARKIREFAPEWAELHGFDLPDFDLTDHAASELALAACQPDIIINCAAYTAVDACETHEQEAYQVNAAAVGFLADLAKHLGALLVYISTDYVFDGRKDTPYEETDPVGPLSAYGRTKLAGEKAILDSSLERYLIVRTSWLYGPGGRNFVDTILGLAAEREELRVVADQVGCPTYTGDLAEAIYRLLDVVLEAESSGRPGLYGIYHFSNDGQCSWYDFAATAVDLARQCGQSLKVKKLLPIATSEYPLPAPRPAYSVFSKGRFQAVTGRKVPAWQDGLRRYLAESSQIAGGKRSQST
jgi:dTDP-4-dehydrorhamnose reductase